MLDYVVSKFKPQMRYYVPFWTNSFGKSINSFVILELNSTTTALLQGWAWHYITHESWIAIKTKKPK